MPHSIPLSRAPLCAVALALFVTGCAEQPAPEAAGPVALAVPAKAGSGQAHLATGPGGEVVLSWLEPEGEGTALRFATLEGGGWSKPRTVLQGSDLLVSWADFPAVVPMTPNVWAAHWLRTVPESFASYDIMFTVSTDGGASFPPSALLHDDGVVTEHGFVSWFPWDDHIGVVWLDGRRLGGFFESGEFDADGPPVGTSLRYAKIDYDGALIASGEIDELTCDCCPTAAAVAADGPVIAYRDRSPEELRDIAVRRYVDGNWSEPVLLGPDEWHIEGCPVNGPALDAAGAHVVAAWFTAAKSTPRVRFARSTDAGKTFEAPIDIDTGDAFGHARIVLLESGDALVSWWRKTGDGEIGLAVRRVTKDGTLGDVVTAATNPIAQPLDMPQMVLSGNRLVLAWTDTEAAQVKSVEVPLP